MKRKHSDVDEVVRKIVREHGVVTVIEAVITACDDSADFFHSSNDKKLEFYWREMAVVIFDTIKRLHNILPPTKKP